MSTQQPKRTVGLRRRWLISSILPVITILVLIAALVSIALAGNYYSNARSALEAKANAGTEYFNTYAMTNYDEYYRSATLYAASFEDSATIELQFLDRSGRVEVSTRSLMTGSIQATADVTDALSSGRVSSFRGVDPATGEKIIAASGLLKFNGRVVGIMRLVTATQNLDSQVLLTVLIILAIMTAVIFVIVISSLLLINNVVAPVAAVSDAAKRISGGSYGFQIPNRYADEMGELVDNINDMSLKIGENEKLQTEFISSVSHELRTPLTAIRGNAEMLADPDLPPALHEKFCDIIVNESERLSRLTHDLLTLQRIESSPIPETMQRVNLHDLANSVVDALSPILHDRQANTRVSGEAPDVLGNPDSLRQAVTNLVENASRFIKPGGHINVELLGMNGNSIIAVKDDGCGFGDVDPKLLFDRFYRTDASRTRGTGGTGLGLAIVKSIAEAHDGTVEAVNLPEGGACFMIAIPSIPADISVKKPHGKTKAI